MVCGGGGGTFIVTDNEPLIIAGGGGGAGDNGNEQGAEIHGSDSLGGLPNEQGRWEHRPDD